MPLLRAETIHGWPCKFYDNGVVWVGTTANRFTMNVPADESSWVATRLRAELIRRELATADELAIDEDGEAAMAAKSAAKASATMEKNAKAKAAASPRKKAAAVLEAAQRQERMAEGKRRLAEHDVYIAKEKHKVAKALSAVAKAADTAELSSVAAPIQAKMELFLRQPPLLGKRPGAPPPRSGGLW